jgi:hypothetical protein
MSADAFIDGGRELLIFQQFAGMAEFRIYIRFFFIHLITMFLLKNIFEFYPVNIDDLKFKVT